MFGRMCGRVRLARGQCPIVQTDRTPDQWALDEPQPPEAAKVSASIDQAGAAARFSQGLHGAIHGVALGNTAEIQRQRAMRPDLIRLQQFQIAEPSREHRQAWIEDAIGGRVHAMGDGQQLMSPGVYLEGRANRSHDNTLQVTAGACGMQEAFDTLDGGPGPCHPRGCCRVGGSFGLESDKSSESDP